MDMIYLNNPQSLSIFQEVISGRFLFAKQGTITSLTVIKAESIPTKYILGFYVVIYIMLYKT